MSSPALAAEFVEREQKRFDAQTLRLAAARAHYAGHPVERRVPFGDWVVDPDPQFITEWEYRPCGRA